MIEYEQYEFTSIQECLDHMVQSEGLIDNDPQYLEWLESLEQLSLREQEQRDRWLEQMYERE